MSNGKETKWVSCSMIGLIGLITCLVGIWVPAIYIDGQANANNTETDHIAGAGATLVAMFMCSPAALFIGPACGTIGSQIGIRLGRRRTGHDIDDSIWSFLGAGVTGLVVGAMPFVVLQLLDWLNIEGF